MVTDPRVALRDMIAEALYRTSGRSLNSSDWLSERDAKWLAGAVVDLFPDVSVDGPPPFRFLLRSAPVAREDAE